MADSSDFNYALFEQEEQYEEGPLRDRKSDIYGLPDRDNRKLAELVRDVISLANTACQYRKPAYILLGIAEENSDAQGVRNYRVIGLEEHLRKFPGDLDSNPHQVWEQVKKRLADIIGEYIRPQPMWELRHGTINNLPVAYLIIDPSQPPHPYSVAKYIKAGEQTLRTGQSWIRRGESKREIVLLELYESQWGDVIEKPLVLPSHWRRYFEKFLAQEDIRRSIAVDPFIPLHLDDDSPLESAVERFLSDETKQLLVIEGGAGCGKSTSLLRFAARRAEIGAKAMADIVRREEFRPPPREIPIILSLRGSGTQVDSEEKLRDRLLDLANQLGAFWSERPRRPWGLFEAPDLSWLICLDGLDEIQDDEGQRRFLNDALRPFMDRFPRTKLILTSRPFAVEAGFREWNRTDVASIRALILDEISDYLAAVLSVEAHNDALALLKSEPDLQKICSYPAHLAATVRFFGEGYEAEPADAPAELPPMPSGGTEKQESELEFSDLVNIDAETPESVEELKKLARELEEELYSGPQCQDHETREIRYGVGT